MRISDWSSDVCSSDLIARPALVDQMAMFATHRADAATRIDRHQRGDRHVSSFEFARHGKSKWRPAKTAICTHLFLSCGAVKPRGQARKSVGWGKSVSERVALGGRRIMKKKKQK